MLRRVGFVSNERYGRGKRGIVGILMEGRGAMCIRYVSLHVCVRGLCMSNVRNVGDSTIAGCRYMLNDDD